MSSAAPERRYPTVEELLWLHDQHVRRFGGVHGLRDPAALHAAVMRPRVGDYDDLVHEAAALMESLAMNHPFVDGNKRVAFFGTSLFLRLNGHRLEIDQREAYGFMMDLFDRNAFRLDELRPWLQAHVMAE